MAGMQFYGKKVCFIGAHPDDIELGCGALIARIAGKTDVRCVTFSNNQKNPLKSCRFNLRIMRDCALMASQKR